MKIMLDLDDSSKIDLDIIIEELKKNEKKVEEEDSEWPDVSEGNRKGHPSNKSSSEKGEIDFEGGSFY